MNSSLCVTRLSFTRSRFDLIKGVNFNVKVFFQLFRRGKVNISNSLIGYLIHISWQEPWAFHLCACYLSVDACPALDVYYGAGAMQAWFGKPSLATWTVSRNYFTFGLSYNPNVDEWVVQSLWMSHFSCNNILSGNYLSAHRSHKPWYNLIVCF